MGQLRSDGILTDPVYLRRLVDLLDQTLQHLSGPDLRKMRGPVGYHGLHRLRPPHSAGQLIDKILFDLVLRYHRLRYDVLVYRTYGIIKRSLLYRASQLILGRRTRAAVISVAANLAGGLVAVIVSWAATMLLLGGF